MSTFLSEIEIQNFTYCHSKRGQSHFLNKHDIKHFLSADGNVMLSRSCLDVVREQGWRKKIFLTRTDVLQCVNLPRKGVGIYFLKSGKEIMYVGKTTNFFVRMAGHDKGDIPFDSVSFIPMESCDLDLFEVEYISRFLPRFNVAHNKNARVFRSAKISGPGQDATVIDLFLRNENVISV